MRELVSVRRTRAAIVAIALAACDGSPVAPVVTSVSVEPSSQWSGGFLSAIVRFENSTLADLGTDFQVTVGEQTVSNVVSDGASTLSFNAPDVETGNYQVTVYSPPNGSTGRREVLGEATVELVGLDGQTISPDLLISAPFAMPSRTVAGFSARSGGLVLVDLTSGLSDLKPQFAFVDPSLDRMLAPGPVKLAGDIVADLGRDSVEILDVGGAVRVAFSPCSPPKSAGQFAVAHSGLDRCVGLWRAAAASEYMLWDRNGVAITQSPGSPGLGGKLSFRVSATGDRIIPIADRIQTETTLSLPWPVLDSTPQVAFTLPDDVVLVTGASFSTGDGIMYLTVSRRVDATSRGGFADWRLLVLDWTGVVQDSVSFPGAYVLHDVMLDPALDRMYVSGNAGDPEETHLWVLRRADLEVEADLWAPGQSDSDYAPGPGVLVYAGSPDEVFFASVGWDPGSPDPGNLLQIFQYSMLAPAPPD